MKFMVNYQQQKICK